jgi:hypothetical protein
MMPLGLCVSIVTVRLSDYIELRMKHYSPPVSLSLDGAEL